MTDKSTIQPLAVHQSSKGVVFSHQKLVEPFYKGRLDDLAELSLVIRQNLAQYPDALALAFFLRSSNLNRYKAHFEQLKRINPNTLVRPVGTVFHITPANVDTLFVYSFALSYLCGNHNIVRLSQDRTPLTNDLLKVIHQFMKSHPDFASSTQFISYAHDQETTASYSQRCDFRVIWGGDSTINTVRQSLLNPHAGERVFSSKYSYAVVNGAKYSRATNTDRKQLAKSFYKDIFPFDQAACSSPQIIFWLNKALITQFNTELDQVCHEQHYRPDASLVSAQFNTVCQQATKTGVDYQKMEHFTSLELFSSNNVERTICGGGFLYHISLTSLDELIRFSRVSDQTLLYWGLSDQQKRKLAANLVGVDRIVPVGQALSFETPWDGYDLISDFTRLVTVL